MSLRQQDILTTFEDYLRYEKRYSEHTLEGYLRDIAQFTAYLLRQYDLLDLTLVTHQHIRSWVVSLLRQENKTITVRRKMASLTHLFKWMRRKAILTTNPMLKVHLPKPPERLPKSLPETTLNRLWKSFETDVPTGSYSATRNQVMLGLLYGSGLRRSELIGLRWADVDFARMMLRITGKGRKSRFVPVSDEVLRLLAVFRDQVPADWPHGNVDRVVLTNSGKPCYPKFVYNIITQMLGTVTTAEKKSPHVLRHSMATHLMDHGAELNAVKEILGHSSLAATQIYTHNSISRLRDVYHKAHPAAGETAPEPLGDKQHKRFLTDKNT